MWVQRDDMYYLLGYNSGMQESWMRAYILSDMYWGMAVKEKSKILQFHIFGIVDLSSVSERYKENTFSQWYSDAKVD